MESARNYRQTSTSIKRFVIRDYQQTLGEQYGGFNGAVEEGDQDPSASTGADKSTNQGTNADSGVGTKETTGTLSAMEQLKNRANIALDKINVKSTRNNLVTDLRQYTVRYIFDMLFAARRQRLYGWNEGNGISASDLASQAGVDQTTPQSQTTLTENMFGNTTQNNSFLTVDMTVFQFSHETLQIEQEDTNFSTTGTVRTADGREINFQVDIGMSREFQSYYREDLEYVSFQMCDPLVMNFDTDVAELSDQKFYFDIDSDGEQDEISNLGKGSGYLALDHNEDGIINDGSELFGTESGNGFSDLAKYDQDNNGWIDENDVVWDKLKIWCKDENGQDVLYRLADKGVGAICLQNAETQFSLMNGEGTQKGAIRNTGVFLYENGNAGTVQHVDVVKYNTKA